MYEEWGSNPAELYDVVGVVVAEVLWLAEGGRPCRFACGLPLRRAQA